CIADIRKAYCIKNKISDSSLKTVANLLIALESTFQADDNNISESKLEEVAKSINTTVKRIADIEKYKEANVPSLFTLLPVTSENDRS
ncbi:MAG: hypothetical protein K2M30_03345, partial [Desulfovibrionaceae bacterium]|nr:hypothetical protein [Desulfovibrionaceae bacterium]